MTDGDLAAAAVHPRRSRQPRFARLGGQNSIVRPETSVEVLNQCTTDAFVLRHHQDDWLVHNSLLHSPLGCAINRHG